MTLTNIVLYLILGIIYLAILDKFATSFGNVVKIRVRDKIIVVILWPVYFITFIYLMFKDDNEDE